MIVYSSTQEGGVSASRCVLSCKTRELVEKLRDWCSANAPTATSARWDGTAELDWVTNYSTVRLTLNDPQSTVVTCVLNVADGTISIS